MKSFIKNHHPVLFLLLLFFCIASFILSPELRSLMTEQAKLDSIGHFIGFFCLSLLLNTVFKFPIVTTVVCLIFYAILSEVGQYYLGFRNGEIRDVVADITGIGFYLLLKYIYFIYRQSKTQ